MLTELAALRSSVGGFDMDVADLLVRLVGVLLLIVILYLVVKYSVRAGILLALRQFEQEGGNLARVQQQIFQQPAQPTYAPPAAYPVPRNFDVVDDTPR